MALIVGRPMWARINLRTLCRRASRAMSSAEACPPAPPLKRIGRSQPAASANITLDCRTGRYGNALCHLLLRLSLHLIEACSDLIPFGMIFAVQTAAMEESMSTLQSKSQPTVRKRQSAKKALQALKKLFPRGKTALRFSNPWELLVAVMLSARCTDKKVNEVTE